ncbi:hypothetical protein M9H77_00736 [Catharanthus roseus]|uniref:Uncharacterized protein n=1 Tax=Catharanthus roseus TaxID=4058 RepID=A0ACC0C3N3_CATRO|nr:hypothetical protein M9H77_00736 [Catharanthus roseus]
MAWLHNSHQVLLNCGNVHQSPSLRNKRVAASFQVKYYSTKILKCIHCNTPEHWCGLSTILSLSRASQSPLSYSAFSVIVELYFTRKLYSGQNFFLLELSCNTTVPLTLQTHFLFLIITSFNIIAHILVRIEDQLLHKIYRRY